MAYEVQSFQEDVIERSHHRPVLVDFWAPWCGPCRVLGPVLEKLASEPDAAWSLVKVNSDDHQDLSVQYGVRGIPAVKLFVDGQVVDEFTGALPEYAVRQWLDKALPSERKQQVAAAEASLAEGDTAEAERLLQAVVAAEPNHAQARTLLAQLLVFRDPEQAVELARAAATAEPRYVQIGTAVETVAQLSTRSPEDLPEGPGRDAYAKALVRLADRDLDGALAHFIEVLQQDRYYDDDGARKAGVALFTLLGEQHDITRKHRPIFNMWLY